VARSVDTLAVRVKEEREAADRGRMTTVVVFIILIAVIVGYMSWLRATLKKQLNAESVVNLVIVQGTEVLAQGMGVPREGRAWNELAAVMLRTRLESLSEQMMRELPKQEDEIAQRLTSGIEDGAEYGVQLLTDRMLPELRRTSIERLEGHIVSMMDRAEEDVRAAVDQVIEQNREDLKKLGDEEELQASIGAAFEERMGDYMDTAFEKMGAHLGDAAVSMAELSQALEEGNLTPEQEMEVLMIQVSHHWFSKLEDEDLERALNP
jgi:hypothetical protein